jgi:hypothetical protein
LIVELAYCLLGLRAVTELDEGKSARFAGFAIHRQVDV